MYMNQLTIIGFTGQDADFHYTPNGTAVTTLSVATKESWKNDKNEWQSRTDWNRVIVFGELAEYAKTLVKGSHLMVQGPLRSREYEKDGVKECKNFKAGGPAGMGPRGDVTVDVSCQLARGHTAARDGFKPRFPAGGGFKAVSSRGETHISPGV
jgi:single-stranded DNA-binding protein